MNYLEESASSYFRAALYSLTSMKLYQPETGDREGVTWEDREDCIKRSCTVCTDTKYYSGVGLKKDELGGACSTHNGT
jgi:hypothetical protein